MNKKALAVAISSALAVPVTAQAVSFNISGQVNRAIMFADDGEASDVFFVDNTASNSRFRITGSEDIGNGMKAGFNLEFSAGTNQNVYATIKQSGDRSLPAAGTSKGSGFNQAIIGRRVNEVWFSGNWGKLSLGAGPGAADASAEADLSNTWMASESVWSTWGGALTFRTETAGAQSGNALFGFHTNYDGASRYNRVRYDSPSFGPFTFKASAGVNQQWEVGANLYTSIGGGDLSATFGYSDQDNRNGRTHIAGAASYLFSQGTNITVAYGVREFTATGRDDADNLYVKLGHRWGNNAVSVSWGENNDHGANDSEVQNIAVAFVHTLPKPKVELYAGYHNHSLDDDGTTNTDYEDIDVFFVGSRIKFD